MVDALPEMLLIPNVYARDTTNNQKVVYCQYSGEVALYDGAFSWVGLDFAREHCFARSWMLPDGTISTDQLPGADLHNLFPTDQTDVNLLRSNHPFGVAANMVNSHLDATLWEDANGQKVFEVRDSHKGDVARAIFYMIMR